MLVWSRMMRALRRRRVEYGRRAREGVSEIMMIDNDRLLRCYDRPWIVRRHSWDDLNHG